MGRARVTPKESHDMSKLRVVFSTGSPLTDEDFRYVYAKVKDDVMLASISGGTDICSCFALGNPTLPVRVGDAHVPALLKQVKKIPYTRSGKKSRARGQGSDFRRR